MALTDSTELVIQTCEESTGPERPLNCYPTTETTWGEFKTVNRDDPDMLADVEHQIASDNYAEIGGGASPLIWIFA